MMDKSGEKVKGLVYLVAVFLGCTAIILMPFLGLGGFISAMPWLVMIGVVSAVASCFLLAPCFIKGKKFDPPEGISRTLEEVSKRAGMKKVPELMLVDASEVNAIAYYSVFGPRIAVTQGLIQNYRSGALGEQDVKAIFAHEVAHLSGRHPLKLTFSASWVSIADYMSSGFIVAGSVFAAIAAATRKNLYAILAYSAFAFGLILKLLSKVASIVSFHYQRITEYEADRRGADIVGRERMASMLQKVEELNRSTRTPIKLFAPERWMAPTTNRSWLDRLFDTHPSTEKRVRKLLAESVSREKLKPSQALPRTVEPVCSGCGAKLPEVRSSARSAEQNSAGGEFVETKEYTHLHLRRVDAALEAIEMLECHKQRYT